jgi:hypothetical protein
MQRIEKSVFEGGNVKGIWAWGYGGEIAAYSLSGTPKWQAN